MVEGEDIELSIVMPCLNEAETVGTCITKADSFLRSAAVRGEIVVADNGSTDGSQRIARSLGARVVSVSVRGYGAALLGAIEAARGKYVIMGDADDSYDMSALGDFLSDLRKGADLVMGNRFLGGIEPGAMPFSHQYVGNPALSWLGRLLFKIPVGDFHSGLRGFNRRRIQGLGLSTTGMEFASEMVVRAALANYHITEVPIRLSRDGRSRPPHLRTWRDGWRHLRFLLVYSPRWLFLYPGVLLMFAGFVGIVLLFPGTFFVGRAGLDIHTFVAACMVMMVGTQSVLLAAVARRYATLRGLLPPTSRYSRWAAQLSPERLLGIGAVVIVLGFAGLVWALLQWMAVDFGQLQDPRVLRVMVLAMAGLVTALQLWLVAFLVSLMDIAQAQQVHGVGAVGYSEVDDEASRGGAT